MELAPNVHGGDRKRAREKNDAEMKSNRKWQRVYVSNEFFPKRKQHIFHKKRKNGSLFSFLSRNLRREIHLEIEKIAHARRKSNKNYSKNRKYCDERKRATVKKREKVEKVHQLGKYLFVSSLFSPRLLIIDCIADACLCYNFFLCRSLVRSCEYNEFYAERSLIFSVMVTLSQFELITIFVIDQTFNEMTFALMCESDVSDTQLEPAAGVSNFTRTAIRCAIQNNWRAHNLRSKISRFLTWRWRMSSSHLLPYWNQAEVCWTSIAFLLFVTATLQWNRIPKIRCACNGNFPTDDK